MESYEALAASYDELTEDVAYEKRAAQAGSARPICPAARGKRRLRRPAARRPWCPAKRKNPAEGRRWGLS